MKTFQNKKRLHILDALRGFSIISIMLLHNLENFHNNITPNNLPSWISIFDNITWTLITFFTDGKSYAIFALLFGVTFYIQMNNQEKRNLDFRPRFFWRMIILLGFGIVNSAFFQGDILTVYAILGFFIVPFYKLNNKIMLVFAFILLMQPLQIYNLYKSVVEIDFENQKFWDFYKYKKNYINSHSFFEVAKGNIIYGRLTTFRWSLEHRSFHIFALFLLGLLAGRKQVFENIPQNRKFWKTTLIISSIIFFPLFIIESKAYKFINSETATFESFYIIISSWKNISFTFVMLSVFFFLFYSNNYLGKILSVFSPIGKMSLSNYVFQSIVGTFIYYEFGLGMNKYTGHTYSLIIGIVLSIFCWYFCTRWLYKHKRGPLETLWHKLTWLKNINL